jgi:hypothetical protein
MAKDKRFKPRWLAKLWAYFGGYFWLPCPVCGESFGGQEWARDLWIDEYSGCGVCANCVEEANRRNKRTFNADSHA